MPFPATHTMEALHNAIKAGIESGLPEFKAVYADYSWFDKTLPLPCCFIELTQAEKAQDPGTGQLHLNCRFEARFVTNDIKISEGRLLARNLAVKLAALVNLNRWGLADVMAADVVGAFPDGFDPQMDGYEVWRVEWEQGVFIGERILDFVSPEWTGDELPDTVLDCGGDTLYAG